jgi:hypothetical protein
MNQLPAAVAAFNATAPAASDAAAGPLRPRPEAPHRIRPGRPSRLALPVDGGAAPSAGWETGWRRTGSKGTFSFCCTVNRGETLRLISAFRGLQVGVEVLILEISFRSYLNLTMLMRVDETRVV